MAPPETRSASAKKRRKAAELAVASKDKDYLDIVQKEELERIDRSMQKMRLELAHTTGTADDTSASAGNKGKVAMPVFWEEDVEMWFKQVEGGFRQQNIDKSLWQERQGEQPGRLRRFRWQLTHW